jgi:Flp pilus assembly pilin Flp
MKIRKLFLKDKDGQSLIEFALILPILLLVIFGITELGRAIMVTNILYSASREGARLAAVANPPPPDSVIARVQQVLDAANIEGAAIEGPSYDLPTQTVTVTVTYQFLLLGGGILDFLPDPLLRGTTVMRYEG